MINYRVLLERIDLVIESCWTYLNIERTSNNVRI